MTTRAAKPALRAVALGLVLTCMLTPTSPASALNIILDFDSDASDAPAYDPDGSGLTSMFEFAEDFYEDVFEDTHALTIHYWYDALGAGTRGKHDFVDESGPPWRESEANIRIATGRSWYIDPTPDNNSEFNMEQVLWRDLSGTQKSNWFNAGANIPETFEAGFNGAAVPGGAADGLNDMLRSVIHEVGHALGMSSSATSTKNEVNPDGDYDFNSDFIFGRSLAAEDDGTDIAHLANNEALMCGGCAQASYRALPSHTDLYAMASSLTFTKLDVPRREFYGGSNWNNAGNWSGDTVPGAFDEAYVRNPGSTVTANLSANGYCSDLFVGEGGNVDTESFQLDVVGTATVDGTGSDILIRPSGELEATAIVIQNDAEILMTGGLIDADTMTVNSGTHLTAQTGAATVDVLTMLNNKGTIQATANGTITFTSSGGAVWDIDGMIGNGVVEAISGNITFASGSMADSFDGRMTVGPGHVLTIAEPWVMDIGLIELNGGTVPSDSARLAGGLLTAEHGRIEARGDARILADVSFGSSVKVNVPGAADALSLCGQTTVRAGATFTGDGTLVNVNGSTLTLEAGSTVGVALDNAGTVEIGTSPGDATVDTFSQTSLGTLHVEINGLTAGSDYDQLLVTHTADLGGTLALTRGGGYASAYHDTMTVVAGGAVTNIFDRVTGVLQTGEPAFAVTYQLRTVRFTATLPGDFDVDFDVDFGDFTLLAGNFNQAGKSWVDGDADGNGKANFADFTYLAANFGGDVDSDAHSPAAAPPPGQVELVVDVATGEMWLRGNAAMLSGYSITSAGGSLIPDGDGSAAPFQFYLSNLAGEISGASVGAGVGIDGDVALDAAAFNTAVGVMDLDFSYGLFSQGGAVTGEVIIVPEPTCLVVLGLGGLMLGMKRRRA